MKLHPAQAHKLWIRRYLAPESVEEALIALAESEGRARIVAGGTDLLLEMGRGQRPELDTLIDLSRVEGLDRIDTVDESLTIGATVTHGQIAASPIVVELALPLAQACLEVASPQLRNRATVVGNLVTASPANDTITPLRALGTNLLVESVRGSRSVPLSEFHTGVRKTVLDQDELIREIQVRAMQPSERGVFAKVALRKAQAISVVHMTIILDFDGPMVTKAAVMLGSVAPTIIDAARAQVFLIGRELDRDTIEEAARLVASAAEPIDDHRAPAAYRSAELEVISRRALSVLADCSQRAHWPNRVVALSGSSGGRYPSNRTTISLNPAAAVTAIVNGDETTAPAGPGTLLDWLREVGLTGSKEGCAEGECGACTVYLDGMAVMSCLVPAGRAQGATVVTIEGLADGSDLHPLQQAFLDQGAVQCGFCIPGFIMSGAKLLEDTEEPGVADITAALAGNLCRCTGYYKIIAAVQQASSQLFGQAAALGAP